MRDIDVRSQIWLRHNGLCALCGMPVPLTKMDLDHIIPRAKGGTDDPANLQPAHRSCNRSRGDAYDGSERSVRGIPQSGIPGIIFVSEAAVRFGIARKTLLAQIARGVLPAKKMGSVYALDVEDMETYVRERKGKPGFASPTHPTRRKREGTE